MSIWALLSILGLLGIFGALSVWLQRRFAQQGAGCAIGVLGHRRLGAQQSVWVIEIDRRRFLVGTGRDGTRLLTELDPADPAGSVDPTPAALDSAL